MPSLPQRGMQDGGRSLVFFPGSGVGFGHCPGVVWPCLLALQLITDPGKGGSLEWGSTEAVAGRGGGSRRGI